MIFEFFFINFHPYPGAFVVKLLPSAILILWALELKGRDKILMLSALVFFMLGYSLLDIDGNGLFIGGLILFAMGHIFYLIFAAGKIKISRLGVVTASVVIVYGIVLGWFLRVTPGKMLIPVYMYLLIIIAMAAVAMLTKLNGLLKAGICLFLLSDSMIAIDKFLVAIPGILPVIIFLYFIAQYSIIRGAVLSGTKYS